MGKENLENKVYLGNLDIIKVFAATCIVFHH